MRLHVLIGLEVTALFLAKYKSYDELQYMRKLIPLLMALRFDRFTNWFLFPCLIYYILYITNIGSRRSTSRPKSYYPFQGVHGRLGAVLQSTILNYRFDDCDLVALITEHWTGLENKMLRSLQTKRSTPKCLVYIPESGTFLCRFCPPVHQRHCCYPTELTWSKAAE